MEVAKHCKNSTEIQDIATQLVYNEVAKKLKVILGGGRGHFRNYTVRDEEGQRGYRGDGRDLINEWLSDRKKVGNANYIWNKHDLLNLDIANTDYLLGIVS